MRELAPLAWVAFATLAATVYGILNDQVTISISPEYFTVFKRRQFGDLLTDAGLLDAHPRVQAIYIGALATWWFGLFLGLVVSLTGIVGRRRRLLSREFVQATGLVLGTVAVTSLLFGVGGFLFTAARPNTWMQGGGMGFLDGITQPRPAFVVGSWHDGAYLGGLLGTIIAAVWTWRRRRVSPG